MKKLERVLSKILVFFFTVILVGCSNDGFEWVDEEMMVVVHEDNIGYREYELYPETPIYKELKAIILQCGHNWKESSINFVPELEVIGQSIWINMLTEEMVLNYKISPTKYRQIVTHLQDDALTRYQACKNKLQKEVEKFGKVKQPLDPELFRATEE